ncbi:MAG: DNA translocase FtsK [Rhodothermaceae bacterium]|nr:DNA translocase FtsK [Rhodothermaceae bacterium]MYB91410.1 DNA translocase FtsK [Rhodothermaceae bacterium]MYD67888.1 DNA translocase FtsK [Rhodothermaceae bacterium]MYG43521.1 DNA translocase FtsK [Rhodothermaceae bacterium]MYJ06854.1 DNA translocase FtsK [Rhodothermaceae bacterium]
MATPKTNRRRSDVTPPKPKAGPRIGRKKEVLGILILLVGILLGASGVTYSASDNALIQGKSFLELLFPVETIPLNNAVGPIGAWLAYVIVPSFFGYVSLLLILLVFFYGYLILRKRPLGSLVLPTIHLIWMVGLLGTLLGRIHLSDPDLGLEIWAGQYGHLAASWLNSVLGWLGSWIILGAFLIIGVLLVIDQDIQHWLDRAERLWKAIPKAIREHRQKDKTTPKTGESEKARLRSTWESLDKKIQSSTESSPDNQESDSEPVEDPNATPQQLSTEENAELELSVTGQITERAGHSSRPRRTKIEGGHKYKFPHFGLLDAPLQTEQEIDYDELEENKTKLVEKLARYKIEIIAVNAKVGPTVTLYELTPAPGVKVSRIKSLEDDLAMVMAAQGIRMIIPIPGKSAVGVEIPNSRRELVRVQSVLNTTRFQESEMELPVVLGKTIEGEIFIEDLATMPHLLIAGATGSGKSVGLNTLITGLLYACDPSDLKFVMVDPKKIELQQYKGLERHFLAIPEDGTEAIITEISDALDILRACEREMSIRYDLLKEARVRGVKDYNIRLAEGELDVNDGHKHLPYIIIIIDELADLMMTAGKDVEAPIARLAQMARAVGIHLILATQRPSVDVITGLIKANFPARLAFQVASKVDARTILDQNGAEQLVGNGDMLYMKGSKVLRLQGPFVSVKEIDRLMHYIQQQPGPGPYQLPKVEDEPLLSSSDQSSGNGATDELFEEAARIIVRNQQGSVSLIQRKLSIGYTRAARIIDQLEQAGIVGSFAGGKAREVLVPDEVTLEKIFRTNLLS